MMTNTSFWKSVNVLKCPLYRKLKNVSFETWHFWKFEKYLRIFLTISNNSKMFFNQITFIKSCTLKYFILKIFKYCFGLDNCLHYLIMNESFNDFNLKFFLILSHTKDFPFPYCWDKQKKHKKIKIKASQTSLSTDNYYLFQKKGERKKTLSSERINNN